jgi:hypothetical protein
LEVYFGELDGDAAAEAEFSFFNRLQLENETYKSTRKQRLDDVNELVAPLLPDHSPLAVMDVAVSSGVSSMEWSEHLAALGIEHRMVAGDICVQGLLLTCGKRFAILWQEGGHPLVVQAAPYSLYLVRSGAIRVLTRAVNPLLRKVYRGVERRSPTRVRQIPQPRSVVVQWMPLVSSAVRQSEKISFVQDDISVPGRFREEMDICRAANILNRSYFSDDEIRRMASNLVTRLRPGGLLVVCRTDEVSGAEGLPRNLVTVFEKTPRGLRSIARMNGGSDVEHLLCGSLGQSCHETDYTS